MLDPFASSQQTFISGVVLVDCVATTGSQASVGASTADIMPSEAGAAHDMSSSGSLDTALAALDNPRVAQAPSVQSPASVNVGKLAQCEPHTCFFDASDSLDYKASLAEALARLCRRASQDGQGQSTHQGITDCQQRPVQEAPATTLNLSAATAATDADAAADSPQSSAGPGGNRNTACSESADDASETTSDDDHTATVDALMTSEVQHAAVNQVLDNLLAEVAAPLQPVQSNMPADTSGMASPTVSLPANSVAPQHAAVDQVLNELLSQVSAPLQPVQSSMPADTSSRVSPMGSPRVSLLANCFAPQQTSSLPAVTAPDSRCVSSTTHSQPLPFVATAAKHSSAESGLVVPLSSISGKENNSVVEAGHVNLSRGVNQERAVLGTRGRVCCLDRSTFQEVAQALPTEPSSQVCWMKEKIADLGCGPAHLTILTSLPPPSSALPIVLRLSTGTEDWKSSECSSLAKAAMLMHLCAHPNVVPITLLGVQAPVSPLTLLDPCQVAYFGMPMADLSLEKRMGQQAWGKSSCVASAYRGPSLATLVQHGKAILKPLAHVHRQRVLHRGLTPDHVLLFSKGGDSGVRAASKPAAIKHDIKLGGFGAAAKLTGQGCAIQPSPYRCEEGYVPPEAHQGRPLTTTADVYQFGGLCYFMAMGTHPPAGLHQASLPDCVAEEWRQLVSLCRAGNPVERPTVAQLQLYLHSICHQPVKQVHKVTRPSGKANPAVSAQRYSSGHRQVLPFPAVSHRGLRALEVATSHSAAALPHMDPDALFTPSTTPAEASPAGGMVSSATPSQSVPLTAAAPNKASRAFPRAQRAPATAAQALGAFISVPQLMLGVDQWLPEETISYVEHRQGGSTSSHHAAAGSQQSNGGVDGDTAAAGRGGAAMQLPTTDGGNSGAAHSIGSSQAAAGPLGIGGTGNAHSSQLSCGEQASEASLILRAVAFGHQPPAWPKRSLSELAGYGHTDSTAASGLQAPAVLGYAKTAMSVSSSYATAPLFTSTDNAEQEIRHIEAGHLISPSRFHVSSGLIRSPVARTPPRRDDTALEKGGVTQWIAQAQGKAAHLAAVVNERASGLAEQTSTLLQHWSDSQLSTKTVAVSHTTPVNKRELLWAV
ncbi:TPA: hypothetical protein ACH3X1_013835 [Trebouxia sp. C0004]